MRASRERSMATATRSLWSSAQQRTVTELGSSISLRYSYPFHRYALGSRNQVSIRPVWRAWVSPSTALRWRLNVQIAWFSAVERVGARMIVGALRICVAG